MASKLGAKSWRVVSYPAPRKWYDELIELTEDFQSSLVKRELGELTPLYEASRQVTTMAPVQARMDHFTIDL